MKYLQATRACPLATQVELPQALFDLHWTRLLLPLRFDAKRSKICDVVIGRWLGCSVVHLGACKSSRCIYATGSLGYAFWSKYFLG
jgi:hypothetical protein